MKITVRPALRPLALLLLFTVQGVQAAPGSSHFTSSSFISRAAAIAWANTAVIADITDGLYNPATLMTRSDGLSLHINPIGIALGLANRNGLYSAGVHSLMDEIRRFGLVTKAVSWQSPVFSMALQLSETLPGNPALAETRRFFPSDGLLDCTFSRLTASMRLAEPVAIGAALYAVNHLQILGERERFGGSYGVLIRPSPRMNIGIMYIDIPDQMAEAFLALDRTIDEAMNVGVTYSPRKNLILSLDVRNVSEEEKETRRELHVGGEWRTFSWFSTRLGWYARQPLEQDVFSGGIGIDTRPFGQESSGGVGSGFPVDLSLHYALQYDPEAGVRSAHYLTCSLYL
jgi:hypothetical protein